MIKPITKPFCEIPRIPNAKYEPMENICRRYRKEYRLIAIGDIDWSQTRFLTGVLMAHEKTLELIHEKQKQYKHLMTTIEFPEIKRPRIIRIPRLPR